MNTKSDDEVITMNDVIAAGHCGLGARRWANAHGVDFKRFMKSGLTVDELRKAAPNDALIEQIIERTLVRRG